MFLWCGCHCGPDSVSEIPPSTFGSSVVGSVGSYSSGDPAAPDPPTTPIVPCLVCQFGTAPQVYEFEWDYQGKAIKAYPPRPCCSVYTGQKKYRLYARPAFPVGHCIWSANEKAKRRIPTPPIGLTATCEDALTTRVLLDMWMLPGQIPRAVLTVYYFESDLPTAPAIPNDVMAAEYVLVDANNQLPSPGDKIVCLQQLKFRALWAFGNRPRTWLGSFTRNGVPFGSPCDQDSFSMIDHGLPEYVTATPVPG